MRTGGTILAIGSAAVMVLLAAVFLPSRGSVIQPIAFPHAKHVGGLGLPCTTCHLYAETGARATIPNIEVCRMCHSAPLTDSEEEARLVDHIQAGEPIPWRKVYRVPGHVYFSHRRHTSVAEIPCETCHGAIGEMSSPISKPLVKITMEGCVGCHRAADASDDCISCHT